MIESDVLVIGAGVMGAATARALSRRGLSVNLVEQFSIGHVHGSSHGSSRIFRLSYPEKMYVDMAREALSLWRAAEEEIKETLVVTTGGLDLGPEIERNADALSESGIHFEMIKGADIKQRWPQVGALDDELVLFQADGGVALADTAVHEFVRSAVRGGVKLHAQTRIESLELSDDGVEAHAAGKSFLAGVAVVTAGAWAKPLLQQAGIALDVKPTRETVAYFKTEGQAPPTFVEWGHPAVYALPAPGYGLKAAEHIAGPVTDPDAPGEVNGESIEKVSAWVSRRFPMVDPTPAHAETCLYTNTPDDNFVIERRGPIVLGSPCSGHGFKFAPLIGKRLAELALA